MPSGRPTERRAQARAQKAEREASQERAERRSAQLQSVVSVLHAELDKLARKWPTQMVTDLMVQRVNKTIHESHELMDQEGDDFLQQIAEFVPAGDNPENRDVLLVLAELRAALSRFRSKYSKDWSLY